MSNKKHYDEERGCYVDKNGKKIDERKAKMKKATAISAILAVAFFAVGALPEMGMFMIMGIGAIMATIFCAASINPPKEPEKKEEFISDMELQERAKRRADWDKRMKDLDDAKLRDDIRSIRDYLDR